MNKIKSIFTSFLTSASLIKSVLSLRKALFSVVLTLAFVNPCLAEDTESIEKDRRRGDEQYCENHCRGHYCVTKCYPGKRP